MNSFKMPLVKVIGLLAIAMLLAAGCSETPEDPASNIAPNTFITSYTIEIAPDSSTYYAATVYWRGADPDGESQAFRYWIAGGDTTLTQETSALMSLNFPDTTTSYTFYVTARDNSDSWDATPASIDISITRIRDVTRFVPNTSPVTVPPDGASTSRGVPFVLDGTDVDGIVTSFEWAVDDASHDSMWTSVAPDVIGVNSSTISITLGPSALTYGPHTVFFRAVDNNGQVDPSPISVSIVCEPGYAPELALSVTEGFNYVVPFTDPIVPEVEIEMSVLVDFYYGELVDFNILTSEGDSFTTTEYAFSMLDLGSGSFWVKVTANDAAGNSTVDSTNFGVVELPAGDGVLCINGIDWPTYSEAVPVWSAGAYWGNRTNFKIWDLFTDAPVGGDYADSLLGTGAPPLWLIDTTFFDAIVWVYNNFSGDNAYWEDEDMQAAIMAYLESGGNLWIGGRLGSEIWIEGSQEFNDYCQYSSSTQSITPGYLAAVHTDFTDITIRTGSSSLTDAVVVSHPNAIQIYESDTGVAGLGWIIPSSAAGGSVAFIGGRHYRFTIAELKSNMDVILTNYFGIN